LVLWAEPASANLGVRVLAEGTAALVRRALPAVELAFQGYGPGDAPVRIGDPRRGARRLVTREDTLTDWVRGFDVVVDTRAGDSFADIYGVERLVTMSLMHQVARRAGVPVVLGPQTVGPFGTRRGRLLARHTVRTAALTMARDLESYGVARSLGGERTLLTTDVVFCLGRPDPGPSRDVVVNVSGLLWNDNPHVDHVRYRTVVRRLVAGLRERGRGVALLAHVLDSPLADNDVPVVTALGDELGVEAVLPSDLTDVRRTLSGARLVVGSRMHACLNALSVGTPAVPLAYSRKFDPLLRAVGWDHTVDLRDDVDHVDLALRAADRPELGDEVLLVRRRAEREVEQAVGALAGVVAR
jgi:polysaccharide pyruvyl transferase WcaK-like protein